MFILWVFLTGHSMFVGIGHLAPGTSSIGLYGSYEACEEAAARMDPRPGYSFKCMEDAPT